jgi:hypothetical protein
VLRDEHRVPAIRRLLAVIARMGRRESLTDELMRMTSYGVRPAQLRYRTVAAIEMEAGTEWLHSQPVQPCSDVVGRHERTMSPTF